MESKVCPRCKREYVGYGALSRRDNETMICDNCGMAEAFEDMMGAKVRKGEATYEGRKIYTRVVEEADGEHIYITVPLRSGNELEKEVGSLREGMRWAKAQIDIDLVD